MPKLPTVENLGARSFQDRSAVVRPNVRFGALDQFADTVTNIAEKRTERLDASSLHKAKIHFQKAKLDADTAFDQDPDFETYQKRYDEKISEAMEQASQMVRNSDDRSRFQEELSLYRAEGNKQIMAKAFSKEVDKGLADLDETLMVGRENYLRASNGTDKQFAIDTVNQAIDSAEQATHIDADKAQALRQKHALDLAVASVKVAPPDEKLRLLKSREGVMEFLPLDTRKALIKDAEVQLTAQEALNKSNEIREKGGTLTERLESIHKIKDPDLKKSVKSQVINDYNLEQTAAGEEKYDLYKEIADGLISTKGIPGKDLLSYQLEMPDKWAKLDPKDKLQLENIERSRKSNDTNFGAYHKLNELKRKDRNEAYQYFLDNVSSFSTTEARKQSDFFTSEMEEPKPLFSMKEVFRAKVADLEIKDEDKGLAQMRIQEEFDTWSRANPGKDMSLQEQNVIVDSVFNKVVGSGGWFDIGQKRGFELPKKEVDKARLNKAFEDYARERNNGNPPDERTMELIHDVMVKRGLISE